MYRGIVPPILMEAPKRAVKFAANEQFKPFFTNKQTGKNAKRIRSRTFANIHVSLL